MDRCIICGRQLRRDHQNPYCYWHLLEKRRAETIQHWLETGDTGCGVSTTLRNCIRDYILESQNGKCAICGIETKWNDQELKFILDHIDGDASNNLKDNLRLICPNCDSQ